MMSLLTLSGEKTRSPLKCLLPGFLFVGITTLGLISLSTLPAIAHWGLGSLTFAIVGGILVGNTLYPRLRPYCDEGVRWSKHHLLRAGIILYGFRLSLQSITALGVAGLVIDILMLTSTFLLACFLGRKLFRLDEKTVYLIGAGSSICGAAAVLATAPTIKANGENVAVAVATVVIFGTSAMFLYPWLYQLNDSVALLPFTSHTFGIYIGSTVHEVAQVVAAGHSITPETENTAVMGKMLRVMMLAPFLMLLGGYVQRRHAATTAEPIALAFPWFALGFVAVTAFNSLQWLPTSLLNLLTQFDNVLLAMAMTALGVTTHFTDVRHAGVKPLLLALLLFIWLVVGGAAINLGVNALLVPR